MYIRSEYNSLIHDFRIKLHKNITSPWRNIIINKSELTVIYIYQYAFKMIASLFIIQNNNFWNKCFSTLTIGFQKDPTRHSGKFRAHCSVMSWTLNELQVIPAHIYLQYSMPPPTSRYVTCNNLNGFPYPSLHIRIFVSTSSWWFSSGLKNSS